LAIADNGAYVERVIGEVTAEYGVRHPRVVIGFSQGGAMAYRAAARVEADGLVILAADVPPDVALASALRLPPVLLGRGTADQWYTAEKHEADLLTLRGLTGDVQSCVFEGGHEWAPAFREATSQYLARFG
jgi:predicted esterase